MVSNIISHKKEAILPFATTRMDLQGIILGEISQTEEDKDCMTSIVYGIYKQTINHKT